MNMKVGVNWLSDSRLRNTALGRSNSYGSNGRCKNKDHCEVTTDEFGRP